MTNNAVLQLRAERLARATRPFLARGNRVRRCQRCLLPLKSCLCDTLTPSQAKSRFCLVMFDTEPMKPSNTGRLIADILPDTAAFQWSRTEPPQALLELVQHPDYQPIVVFPASYAGEARRSARGHFHPTKRARSFPPRPPGNRRCLLCWTALGPKHVKCFVKALIWIICRSFPSIYRVFQLIVCVKSMPKGNIVPPKSR
ncbi:hypothetical protein LTSEALA_1834 [Salmonella enterica subsp. enterica serovar Alachua str. R6-377]|uniref:tRNA-uridine aminocarboxypropyltransferase n=1 Tax=Salmonella enterica subsp. enterica serovar Alachua str. R6-377 TaxID=913241 RepID=G5LMP9_SALET|nr:hypothetical protein LTSEALA_1834 [Salmonella enterica subsp. enterica serovar Alachua str. R6-377]